MDTNNSSEISLKAKMFDVITKHQEFLSTFEKLLLEEGYQGNSELENLLTRFRKQNMEVLLCFDSLLKGDSSFKDEAKEVVQDNITEEKEAIFDASSVVKQAEEKEEEESKVVEAPQEAVNEVKASEDVNPKRVVIIPAGKEPVAEEKTEAVESVAPVTNEVSSGEQGIIPDIVINPNESSVAPVEEVTPKVEPSLAIQENTGESGGVASENEAPALDSTMVVPLANSVIEMPQYPALSEEPVVESISQIPAATEQTQATLITFAAPAGYKGRPLSVNPGQGEKLRNSRLTQKAQVVSIFPYLGKESIVSQPAAVSETTMEIPAVGEDVSEEQLAEMLNQVTTLYNNKQYEEAEALSKRVSVLSKKYSAQSAA